MELNEFFKENAKVALAFSGGVDSCYLLWSAINSGADVTAYFVKTEFQPNSELVNAIKFASTLRANMKIIHASVIGCTEIVKNDAERCYFCKSNILKNFITVAKRDGYSVFIDGTNATDLEANDRAGVKALEEFGVLSPLADAGLKKEDVRTLAKEAGLAVWDKPSYACLATRVKTDEEITSDKLEVIELCEAYLAELGLTDFRLRVTGDMAVLEITENDVNLVLENRKKILDELGSFFGKVTFDLNFRK